MEKNFAEGFVLKPVEEIWIDGERVSIKFKNSKCLETAPAVKEEKKPAPKKEVVISKEDQEVIDRCMAYVNKERLENIATKLTEDERNAKNVNKLMIADIWKDFGKAEDEKIVNAANKIKGKIMPLMQKEIGVLFEEYSQKL